MVRVVIEDQRSLADPEEMATVRVSEVGVGEHVFGRAAGHDASGEEQEVVRCRGIAEVVGGHDHRAPGIAFGGDGIKDVLA